MHAATAGRLPRTFLARVRAAILAVLLCALVLGVGAPHNSTASEPPASGSSGSRSAFERDNALRGPRLARVGSDRAVPAPRNGAWFGVSVDWSHDSLAAYARRLGHAPSVAVTFTGFPMSPQERSWFRLLADQARDTGSIVLLTLEPHDGLDVVTRASARRLARTVAAVNRRGVRVVVRFAHEMNGSWYPWGQQPSAYVAAFRRVAAAVHARTRNTALLWAPNYGGGYPFASGLFQAPAGSAAADAMDSDDDGSITRRDDPYAPYWPGRRYVDWVGMSLYHWGNQYPWGENEVPEDGKFGDLLHGTYRGTVGNELAVPDFYNRYGERLRLPVAITETAALYVPGRGGATELAVKRAWWRQVFAAGHARSLPWLKMINWFEWRKHEPEVGGTVDWAIARDKTLRTHFARDVPDWLRFSR